MTRDDLNKKYASDFEYILNTLYINSFEHSETPRFKLASGDYSNYYVNCKLTTMVPDSSSKIGFMMDCYINELLTFEDKLKLHAIGGLTMGADPIAAATMHVAYDRGLSLNQLSVRKELKEHGIIHWVDGRFNHGDGVIVVDDVVTTGDSVIKSIYRMRMSGLKVLGVLILLDREECDGMAKIQAEVPGKLVTSIVTISDLMEIHNNRPIKDDG